MTELTRKEFLRLVAATASVSVTGGLAVAADRSDASRAGGATPARRTLIRGADVLTMDARLGELTGTDVLIDNGRIVEIGKGLQAGDAALVDGRGMILMPGMIDGHRHIWQSLMEGMYAATSGSKPSYMEYVHLKLAVSYRPEDVYLANYVGGLQAIDSGVTSVVDHAHISHTREKAEAAVRGLKDAGVGGFSCYQISYTPSFGPDKPGRAATAWLEFYAPPDDWHYKHAASVRDKYFSSSTDPLQFGVALSHAEYGPRTPQQVQQEIKDARQLKARLMTQHIQGYPGDRYMKLPKSYRVITDLHQAGLLGEDYHLSHGNGLTDVELLMLRDTGGKVCATTMGEVKYEWPSVHGRAHLRGVPAGIGIDVPMGRSTDFFTHVRSAFQTLFQSTEGRQLTESMESTDVLSFATLGGARAIGLDSEIGSITVGKRADLVLLSTSRFGFPSNGTLADRVVNFANIGDVDSVWVAGKLRKQNGRIIGFDWKTTQKSVDAARDHIVAQAARVDLSGTRED